MWRMRRVMSRRLHSSQTTHLGFLSPAIVLCCNAVQLPRRPPSRPPRRPRSLRRSAKSRRRRPGCRPPRRPRRGKSRPRSRWVRVLLSAAAVACQCKWRCCLSACLGINFGLLCFHNEPPHTNRLRRTRSKPHGTPRPQQRKPLSKQRGTVFRKLQKTRPYMCLFCSDSDVHAR